MTLSPEASVKEAIEKMRNEDISQMPVAEGMMTITGSISETKLLAYVLDNPLKHTDATWLECHHG